jgi:HSP20 family protein
MSLRSLTPFGRFAETRPAQTTSSGDGNDPFFAMRREMDRLFDTFSRGLSMPMSGMPEGYLSPRVNIAENATGLELTAELPGIEEKDIDVSLAEGVLTLKAEHRVEKEEKDEAKQYHLVERSYGTFLRRFALPFEPDADKIEASFDKGVLKVVVPRMNPERSQVRKIAIKGN